MYHVILMVLCVCMIQIKRFRDYTRCVQIAGHSGQIDDEDKTMTLTHGSVGEFNNAEEDWKTYVERVDLYFTANEITNAAKKRAVLLSVCGAKTYHTIRISWHLQNRQISVMTTLSRAYRNISTRNR